MTVKKLIVLVFVRWFKNMKVARIRNKKLIRPKAYLFLAIFILLFVLPFYLSRYYIHLLTMIFIFAVAAEAWNIIGGYGGQFSLGHATFFGIGAYTSTMLFYYLNVSPWIGLFLGGIGAVLLSIGISHLCFHLRGPYFVIFTIGLTEVFRYLFLNQRWITLGARGMNIRYIGNAPLYFQFPGKLPYYYIALLTTLIVVFVTHKMINSQLGYYIVALGQNQGAAEAIGVNSFKVKLKALCVSAFFTSFAGTLYAQYIYFIDPDTVFGISLSIQIMLFAVVGGAGTLWGPVIGTFILQIATEWASATFGAGLRGLHFIIFGAILIIIVLSGEKGMIGVFTRSYQRIEMLLAKNWEKE